MGHRIVGSLGWACKAALALLCIWTAAAPADPELQGRPVLDVRLHREGVFTEDEARAPLLGWFYELANKLHVTTRPYVIRNELLLTKGTPYDSLRLAESIRLLRERRIFEEVRGWAEPADSGVVAHIHTQDYWTLNLQTGFGKEGGETDILVGLFDSNVLGTGNILSFSQRWSTDRDQTRWAFAAPRVLGRREVLSAQYRDNTDGLVREAFLGKGYENHVAPWSYSVAGVTTDGRYRVYERDEDVARIHHSENIATVHTAKYPGRTFQIGGGAGAFLYDYEPGALEVYGALEDSLEEPVGQRLRMGLLLMGLMQRRFIQTRNVDRFDVVEDYPLGWSSQLVYGHNFTALSGEDERNYIGLNAAFSAIAGRWWLSGSGIGSLFWQGDRAGERRARVAATVLRRWSLRSTGVLRFTGRWGEDLPTEERIYLGGSSMRGYPLRELGGKKFVLFNAEHRWWSPLKVLFFRFGASAFWDSALTAGSSVPLGASKWRHGAGLGILVGNRKSSSGFLRVEFARRLDGGDDPFDLLITTGNVFNLVPRVELGQPVVDIFSRRP